MGDEPEWLEALASGWALDGTLDPLLVLAPTPPPEVRCSPLCPRGCGLHCAGIERALRCSCRAPAAAGFALASTAQQFLALRPSSPAGHLAPLSQVLVQAQPLQPLAAAAAVQPAPWDWAASVPLQPSGVPLALAPASPVSLPRAAWADSAAQAAVAPQQAQQAQQPTASEVNSAASSACPYGEPPRGMVRACSAGSLEVLASAQQAWQASHSLQYSAPQPQPPAPALPAPPTWSAFQHPAYQQPQGSPRISVDGPLASSFGSAASAAPAASASAQLAGPWVAPTVGRCASMPDPSMAYDPLSAFQVRPGAPPCPHCICLQERLAAPRCSRPATAARGTVSVSPGSVSCRLLNS